MTARNYARKMQRHVAAIETVGSGVYGRGKGARAARSYRGARRNLARAVRFMVPGMPWPAALANAAIATADSLKPAPIIKAEPCPTCGEAAGKTHCFKCSSPERVTVADEVDPFPGAVEAEPEAPAKPKRVRKPKVVATTPTADAPEVAALKKPARKRAAPKADATPKAPKKSTAKAAPKTSAKPAAAPRKRAPAKSKAA